MPAIAGVAAGARTVTVTWTDGSRPSEFHHLWLRDNCACPACRHPDTWERTLDTYGLPFDLTAETVSATADEVVVEWPDAHVSRFAAGWLHAHRLGGDSDPLVPRQVPWDASLQHQLPEVAYDDVLAGSVTSSDGLRQFVRSVWAHGVTFVRGTPGTQEALLALARRVGHLRETNFGLDWHVEAKPQPNNVAYTAIELQLHTDLPNREAPPGIQFLHCLAADAPGGDSTLADGLWVAEQIRHTHPDAFALLSTVPISYRFHDVDHDLRWRAPVIGLADDGAVREVRFHTALREPLDVANALMEPMHRALHAFEALCRSERARVSVHLQPGDVMVFHNRRVLHGRTAFDPGGGRRSLHGAYVDVDEWLSRIRTLGTTEDT